MKDIKVCIIGLDYLPAEKSSSLLGELRKRSITLAEELNQANVVIYVVSEADPEKKLRNRAIELDIPIIPLLPYHDTILGNMMIGVAVLPEDAAQWAWSAVNEREKWVTPRQRRDRLAKGGRSDGQQEKM